MLPVQQLQPIAAVPQLSVINAQLQHITPSSTTTHTTQSLVSQSNLTADTSSAQLTQSNLTTDTSAQLTQAVNDFAGHYVSDELKSSYTYKQIPKPEVKTEVKPSDPLPPPVVLPTTQSPVQVIPVSSIGITIRLPISPGVQSPLFNTPTSGTTIQQVPLTSLPPNIQSLLNGSGNLCLQTYKTSTGQIIACPTTISPTKQTDLGPLPSAVSLSDAVMKLPTVPNLLYSTKPSVAATKTVQSSILKTVLGSQAGKSFVQLTGGSVVMKQAPPLASFPKNVVKSESVAVGSGLLAIRSTTSNLLSTTQVLPISTNATAQTLTVNSTSTQPSLPVKVSSVAPLAINTNLLSTAGSTMTSSTESTSSQAHTCDKCNSTFESSYSLKVHMLVHRGGLPAKCATCGKEFLFRSDLERHSSAHPGSKPFKCPICGNGFQLGSSLKRHMFIHTGKPTKPGTTPTDEKDLSGPSSENKDVTWNDDPNVTDLEAYVRMHIQRAMADKNYGKEVPMRRRYSDEKAGSNDGDYESMDDCDSQSIDEQMLEMTHIERLSRKSGSNQAINSSSDLDVMIPTTDAGAITVTVTTTITVSTNYTTTSVNSGTTYTSVVAAPVQSTELITDQRILSPNTITDQRILSPNTTTVKAVPLITTSTTPLVTTALSPSPITLASPSEQVTSIKATPLSAHLSSIQSPDTIDITSESSLEDKVLHKCDTCGECFSLLCDLHSHLQTHLTPVVPDGLINIPAEDISLLDMAQHPTHASAGLDKQFSEFVDLERYVESTEEALLNIDQPSQETKDEDDDMMNTSSVTNQTQGK